MSVGRHSSNTFSTHHRVLSGDHCVGMSEPMKISVVCAALAASVGFCTDPCAPSMLKQAFSPHVRWREDRLFRAREPMCQTCKSRQSDMGDCSRIRAMVSALWCQPGRTMTNFARTLVPNGFDSATDQPVAEGTTWSAGIESCVLEIVKDSANADHYRNSGGLRACHRR